MNNSITVSNFSRSQSKQELVTVATNRHTILFIIDNNNDFLLIYYVIRSYFSDITVFHKDELSLHLILNTVMLF